MSKYIPIGLFVVLVGFLYVGLDLDPKKLPSPLIGKKFPEVVINDFATGQEFKSTEYLKGKVTMVNVWASWCITCRAEQAMINKISQENNINMVGINYKDEKEDALQYLDILGNAYDSIIYDRDGKLSLELGVYATPETFIVDKNGIIKFKHIGEITSQNWEKVILPKVQELNQS
jgi:cytochrome c biogenesis protein CcmG/thiol:disulfide interchange protein DsbE